MSGCNPNKKDLFSPASLELQDSLPLLQIKAMLEKENDNDNCIDSKTNVPLKVTEWDMELALHANLISPICQTDFRAVDRYILLHSGEPYQTIIITKTSPSIYSFPSLKQVSN